MDRAKLAIIIVLVVGLYWECTRGAIRQPPGVLVAQDPQQFPLDSSERSIKYKDTVIDPLADYKVRGRVLGTERYWIDAVQFLAPVDVALGWGRMSDSAVLDQLHISQGNRFYFYEWKNDPPIPAAEIASHSANMHLIPSNAMIEKQIKKLRVGQVISLQGKLVRVNMKDGGEWKSSLAREDRGNGACEIMWVTSLFVED